MSRDIANWLRRDVGVDPARIRQIYNGVDVARFSPAARTPGEEARSITIGTIGRLDPVKNHTALLKSFRAILDSHPAWVPTLRLEIAGDGPLRAMLDQQIRALGLGGNVSLLGARSDIPDVMRSFDVFVLPSLNEGISNTALEAMATGLPVVAGRVGGNPEIVLDGVTGSLYDTNDPRGLESALLPYLADPSLRHTRGMAGRRRAAERFSLDAMVRQYVSLYDEVMHTCAA